ncbi:insulinase family protein [Hominifimenecus sp. rT4P-3]|uniref:insulinase family protein n=1 Tax=Hominifimenecus sp. rT4P-3 TaxID=3242979 RepID=UPI003DA5767C
MNVPESYTLLREEAVKELRSQAYLLCHKKSGARLFLLSNEDENKVFTIGFRTPAGDSTGVPHILEHAVLCGSDKFPLKDPFIEMEKSSLQTYLNAMTFADKTIYPVASCNEKDFQNLMDVYMDAVLHPAIYREPKIFRQEGWHYELRSPDEALSINGVVYNEMKGAFSSPDEVLERYCQAALFPDNTYQHESGGDPEVIPELTYEAFLQFHKTYYHPSNSYIYLYGNMDMEEKLLWLDREYLCHYEKQEVDSEIPLQKPFDAPVEQEVFYPLEKGEDPSGQTWLSVQWVLDTVTKEKLYLAFQVLEYVLLTAPGAPLRKALIDAGIGKDVFGGYRNWILQPYFTLVAKDTEKTKKEEFLSVVQKTLAELVEKGIDRKALKAGINNLEFRSREADFGSYPKGLMYGIECFDSWLYGSDPLLHLKYEATYAFLKEQMDTGYFEDLVRQYFLENTHQAVVILSPEPGLSEEREAALAARLSAYQASLSREEISRLIRETEELERYQDQPSSPEDLATLPRLTLDDIGKKIPNFSTEKRMAGRVPVLFHETFTGKIAYLRFLFDARKIKPEEIPYLGMLRSILCLVDTGKWEYADLCNEINIHTGGIGCAVSLFEDMETPGRFTPYFEIQGKALYDDLKKALELIQEIAQGSLFTDEKRLRELVFQIKSRGEMQMVGNGHSTAVLRANSYGSPVSWFSDQQGGVAYFRFIEDLQKNFEERKGELQEKLKELTQRLFVGNGMLLSLTADEEGYQAMETLLPAFGESLNIPDSEQSVGGTYTGEIPLEKKNEGFTTPGQVVYVARCGNFRKAGLPYTGALRVLRGILGDEYLWNNVRVKGGAYGCMCNFGRTGNGFFCSYRDPNLRRTNQVYENIVPYLEQFSMEQEELVKFIISAIGTLDRPLTPSEWGVASLQAYLGGITDEMRQRDRDQVLSCTPEVIRTLSSYVRAILDCHQICTVGNAGKIEEDRELFLHTEPLVRS